MNKHITAFLLFVIISAVCLQGMVSAIEGDLNGDDCVGWPDIGIMSDQWMTSGTADLNGSGLVNWFDFALLANNWLDCGGGQSFDPNMAGWYPLDENTGSIAHDASGRDNHGSVVTAAWSPTGGKMGGAASFNGATDRIEVPTLYMKSSIGTVSLWAKLNDAGQELGRFFFGCRDEADNNTRIQIYMYSGRGVRVGLGNNWNVSDVITTLSTSQWYHIALTWNKTNDPNVGDGDWTFYLDPGTAGELVRTGKYSRLLSIPSSGNIGNNGAGRDEAFKGLIDDVVIFNRVLSKAELEDISGRKMAYNPSPANYADFVALNPTLSWTSGAGATSHNVYFGTNKNSVSAGTGGTNKGNRTANTYTPAGPLAEGVFYYWRIDENNAAGTTNGLIWQFKTLSTLPPNPATGPGPVNGAADVTPYANLSWTTGYGATSHDVCFGTSSSPPLVASNVLATAYDLPTLADLTTYYWRINPKNIYGTTTGSLWSFKTGIATPVPANCVAWWRFEEGSGNMAYDSTPNGNHGTILGATWTTNAKEGGHALSFGGNSVVVPDSPSIEFGDQDFTVAFWMKGPNGSFSVEECRILQNGTDGKEGGNGKRYQFMSKASYGHFRFVIDDDTDPDYGKSTATANNSNFLTGDWVHVAGARDTVNNKIILYCNGFAIATAEDRTGDIASPDEPLYIASGPGSGYNFNGILDDVRIYNVKLRPAEIERIYHGDLKMAWDPVPANWGSGTGIGADDNLSWTAGEGATSHDVYFGTNLANVTAGTGGTLKSTAQTAAAFEPGTLAVGTFYYWRVDERSPAGLTKGAVWRFIRTHPKDIPFPTDCTEAALRKTLTDIGAAGGGYVTFNCSNTMIGISDRIDFYGDYMTLDGNNTGIIFTYTGPDPCNQTEDTDYFIEIQGNSNRLANFILYGIPDGIHIASGYDNVVENISWPTICEDALTNSGSGEMAYRTIVRGCYFHDAQDKAVMINKGGSIVLEHCEFDGCRQPIRVSSTDTLPLALCVFRNNTVYKGLTGHKYSPNKGLNLGAGSTFAENNILRDCVYGVELWMQGNLYVEAYLKNNYFINNSAGDIRVYIRNSNTSAGLRVEYNELLSNSTSFEFDTQQGPCAIDLGGGNISLLLDDPSAFNHPYSGPGPYSSAGLNYVAGTAPVLQNSNNYVITAKNNEWACGTTCASVLSNCVNGDNVEVCPLAAPGTGGNIASVPTGPQQPLDTTAPTPNPMTFAVPPAAAGTTSITMTATTASDPSGVKYYFDETTGNPGGSDSVWQDSPTYTDTGLQPSMSYTYKVKACDKASWSAELSNQTGFSLPASATTATPEPPPTVTVTATDASASESGGDTGTFTVSRSSGMAPLTVYYTVSGTATAGTDYQTLTGSVVLSASPATITVTVIDDLVIEPGETVIITLSANAAYVLGSPSSATVTIAASDQPDCADPGWVSLTCDSFENGWGFYTASGTTAAVNCASGHATDGSCVADIENTGSFAHTTGLDLTSYKQLKVKFDFFASTNLGTAEGFKVEYYDGTAWQLLKQYVKDTNFTVGTQYTGVELYAFKGQYAFPAAAKIRFTCVANNSSDDIYIDNVKVTANVNASASEVELFFDNFEGGSLAAAGWTVDNSSNAKLDGAAKHGGSGSGLLIKQASWAQKMLPSTGFQNMHVKYWRKTVGFETDSYITEWSTDGSIWNTLETVTGNLDWVYMDNTCGSGANNNGNYRVRLHMAGNDAGDNIYIDDVSITGYQMP